MKIAISLIATALATGSACAADDKPLPDKKPTAQQIKMKECNAQAGEKGLKKAERRAFMSECLKSHKQ